MKTTLFKTTLFGAGSVSKKWIQFERKWSWRLRVVAVGEINPDDGAKRVYRQYKNFVFLYCDRISLILEGVELKSKEQIAKNANSNLTEVIFLIGEAMLFLLQILVSEKRHEKDEDPDPGLLHSKSLILRFKERIWPRLSCLRFKLSEEMAKNPGLNLDECFLLLEATNEFLQQTSRLGSPKP